MLKPVRIEAGLGNPPKEYTNNDPEAANFIIKHALKFDAKKPHEFIHEIKNIIETQYRNEDRAVFGKGPYEVRPEFQHLAVDDRKWSQMTHEQRMAKLNTYRKSDMKDKKTLPSEESGSGKQSTQSAVSLAALLPVTASGCGVTTVPMPILRAMFEKANRLLNTPDHVIPKPGATDGSFIVAGHGNQVHCVTPGKGGCLKCDRICVNSSTKICEHVLAVAHVRGSLAEYLAWYRRSRKGPRVLEMALGSGPKNAGKKPSKRKKTNARKPLVNETVGLLEQHSAVPAINPPTIPLNAVPIAAPDQMHLQNLNNWPNNSAPATAEQHSAVPPMNTPTVTRNTVSVAAPDQTHPPAQTNWPNTSVPATAQQHHGFQIQATSPHQSCSFKIKWVMGTRVSRCYGCNKEIKNPPESIPDDLIVVFRDIRQFRDRQTGQVQFTREPQNVHFHLRAACIRARYPSFHGASALFIPPDFPEHFRIEHIQRLNAEFGWTP